MYGDLAAKLIQDSKRTQSLDVLPSYQTDFVNSIVREIRDLQRDVKILLDKQGPNFRASQDRRLSCAIFVLQICMRRNKRCLLAYHALRAQRLEALVWSGLETTSIGIEDDTDDEVALSERPSVASGWHPDEEEYFRGHGDALAELKGEWTDVDLTGSMEPPRDLFIDVRVLKDAGEIQTEYGLIALTKNSQFYVRQGDVERLIQQGYIQKLR
ncbi:hypothetical protein V1517DRAFT_23320 [Lipomyces orientalis]|uniref:Uncharacterized protein n=1 Tax=Lipomyces orientalis TaxID=1233043 RepID=A0ACC3TV56_9ASCO